MCHFKFVSRKTSHIPFPSLVSLILFYHKIWYVGPPESMKYIPAFGKSQLNLMKISFEPEGSGQSRAPPRSYTRASQKTPVQASQSMPHEAQSAPAPSLDAEQVKAMIDAAMASLFIKMQFEIGKLGADIKMGLNQVISEQEEMRTQLGQFREKSEKKQEEMYDQLIDLDARLSITLTTASDTRDKVDKIINHFDIGASSSTFGFTTAPTTSPSQPSSPPFVFPSPPQSTSPASTPATVILPSPSTPATVILPSPSTPSTEILQPSPPIDDAKGGEEQNM